MNPTPRLGTCGSADRASRCSAWGLAAGDIGGTKGRCTGEAEFTGQWLIWMAAMTGARSKLQWILWAVTMVVFLALALSGHMLLLGWRLLRWLYCGTALCRVSRLQTTIGKRVTDDDSEDNLVEDLSQRRRHRWMPLIWLPFMVWFFVDPLWTHAGPLFWVGNTLSGISLSGCTCTRSRVRSRGGCMPSPAMIVMAAVAIPFNHGALACWFMHRGRRLSPPVCARVVAAASASTSRPRLLLPSLQLPLRSGARCCC